MRHIFHCLDGHTCGNPVRLITGGAPKLVGETMLAKRADFMARYDWIRTGLMFEPRGHAMMSGGFLYPSTRLDCDIAILYIETSGCLPMCGHGTIGMVTMGLDNGLIVPRQPGVVALDTPAGKVLAHYERGANGQVASVTLTNVASFLWKKGIEIHHPALGGLVLDVAYGGNFYAIIEPQDNYSGLDGVSAGDLIGWSRSLREIVQKTLNPIHPLQPNIEGIRHVMWTGTPRNGGDGRNAVFYGEGAIDRSPCGTGTSARLAQLHARGNLALGQPFVHESIIGSHFIGTAIEAVMVGDYPAIIPSVQGWAKLTGINTIYIDEDDPFHAGFSVD